MSSINSRVPPLRLMAVDTPSDGQLPSYQSSSGQFEWVDDSSGGTPGGSNNEIQYNNSGAFGGDAGFIMSNKAGGAGTSVKIGEIVFGGSVYAAKADVLNRSLLFSPEGTGQVTFAANDDAGGTKSDLQVNINSATNTDEAILKFGNQTGTVDNAEIKMDNSSNLTFENQTTNQNIEFTVKGTGQIEVKQSTTNNDSNLLVRGNGTGTPKVTFTNETKAITVQCDENNKLKVQGALYDFIFDCSSASGGITFPDGTTQTTAASGGDSYGSLADPTEMNSASLKINTNQRVGGGTYGGTAGIEYFYGPILYPFVSPHTGTVANMTIEVVGTAAGRSVNIGIYSTDSDTGLPDSLISTANISMAVAGQITQTTFTGTPSLTKGVLYWIGQFSNSASSGGGSAKGRENNPSFNAPSNIVCGLESGDYFGNSLPNCIALSGETSLPSTVTATDCKGENRDLIDVILGW